MVKVRELIRHKNPDFIPSDWEFVELGEIGNLLSSILIYTKVKSIGT
jgi:hypothetical protein